MRTLLHPFSESTRFSWHLDSTRSSSVIVFKDGTYLTDLDISGVLLRRTKASGAISSRSDNANYIHAEIQAAILAWIWSLPCPVINRVPAWLWYYRKPPLQFWNPLFRTNGLLEPDYDKKVGEARITNQDPPIVCSRACVVNQDVIWSEARPQKIDRYETALIEFTRCAGLSLLEIVIVKTRDGLAVKQLDPFPDLSRFCISSRDAITEALVKLFTDSNRRLGSQ